ncbi:MAG: hypothetical protein JNL82_03605 [Myxococcales bacterium]|nr:hypothetical protein [Myxococcales bacterium]
MQHPTRPRPACMHPRAAGAAWSLAALSVALLPAAAAAAPATPTATPAPAATPASAASTSASASAPAPAATPASATPTAPAPAASTSASTSAPAPTPASATPTAPAPAASTSASTSATATTPASATPTAPAPPASAPPPATSDAPSPADAVADPGAEPEPGEPATPEPAAEGPAEAPAADTTAAAPPVAAAPVRPPRVDGPYIGATLTFSESFARVNDFPTPNPFSGTTTGLRFGQAVFPWMTIGLQVTGTFAYRFADPQQRLFQGAGLVDFGFLPVPRIPLSLRVGFGAGGGAVREAGVAARSGFGGAVFTGSVRYEIFPLAARKRPKRGGGFALGPELGWVGFTPAAKGRPMSNTVYLGLFMGFYFGS